tara:strand:- start:332 stop:787 length:456 start_codon:yes stop_codon:yes gene_type:complete
MSSNQTVIAPENVVYTENQSLEEQFQNVSNDLQKIGGTARHLQLTVKELQRNVRNACKPRKVKKHTVMHDPMTISAELLKYLKQPAGTTLTKSESMKAVSLIIKNTNLQNAENRRMFTPDKALGKVLNMTPIKSITFVELNKYLAHHFTPN